MRGLLSLADQVVLAFMRACHPLGRYCIDLNVAKMIRRPLHRYRQAHVRSLT